jgi:transaldolase
MRLDSGDAEAVLAEFTRTGIDPDALAADLQRKGAKAFATSWSDLMAQIASKSDMLKNAKRA